MLAWPFNEAVASEKKNHLISTYYTLFLSYNQNKMNKL